MLIAVATRQRAECIGRHVGAVLVREGRIVATGYNGTPRGFPRCNAEEQGCHRCANRDQYPSGSAYDVCICVHAEQNAVLQAARLGYSLEGGALLHDAAPVLRLPQGAAPGGRRAHRLPQPVGSPAARSSAPPTTICSGISGRSGSAIEHLDLDPAVLAARRRGTACREAGPGVRRPPPIAALFTVLAAGLALIAVAAWGGWSARRRAGRGGARDLDGGARRAPRRWPPQEAPRGRLEDSVDPSLTRRHRPQLVFKGALAWEPKASPCMRDDTLIPSAPAVERLDRGAHRARRLAAHGAGAARRSRRAVRLPRAAGDDARDLRQRAAAALAGAPRRAPARTRHRRPPPLVGARAVRRSRAPGRARGRPLARARRPAPAPAPARPRHGRRLHACCSTATGTTTLRSLRDRALLELLYGCGLRASEVCGLELAAYDAVAGRLRVIGKGDRERMVPVGEPAREALDAWLRERTAARRGRIRRAAPERPRPPALAFRRAQDARAARPHRRRQRPLARTRCGTPTLHICWRGARVCARSRSCSATRRPRRPRSTRTSPFPISCASTPTTTHEDDGCRNHHRDDRARAPRRARRDLAPVQVVGRPRAARPPDPDLRAARQVRRRQARLVAAAARRGGRPDLLRPARPDRRDRALRASTARSSSRRTRSRASAAR